MSQLSLVGKVDIPAGKFYEIFRKYATDDYIQQGELDRFIVDMIEEAGIQHNSSNVAATKSELIAKYDTDFDGKISASELTKILVPEKNILAQFGGNITLTSVDFMKVWRKYDADNNGHIEEKELEGFLHDLLTLQLGEAAVKPSKLKDYKNAMLDLFDENHDGAFSLSELAEVLPVDVNFLTKNNVTQTEDMSNADFEKIASHYDQDKSGFFERAEMEGLVRDFLENQGASIDGVGAYTDALYKMLSIEKTGKVSRSELQMVLMS